MHRPPFIAVLREEEASSVLPLVRLRVQLSKEVEPREVEGVADLYRLLDAAEGARRSVGPLLWQPLLRAVQRAVWRWPLHCLPHLEREQLLEVRQLPHLRAAELFKEWLARWFEQLHA